jgi:hypothetical protein
VSENAYLLAGQASELDRLQLQSRVWEPAGRRLLDKIGEGRGARALDVGCGVMGWLRLLSEWVGPDGEVMGTDIDDAMPRPGASAQRSFGIASEEAMPACFRTVCSLATRPVRNAGERRGRYARSGAGGDGLSDGWNYPRRHGAEVG